MYFGLLEETTSQVFKERKTYIYKNKGKHNEGMDYDCKDEKFLKILKKEWIKISWLEKERKRKWREFAQAGD